MNSQKEVLKVGDRGYIQQGGRSYGCVADVKTPYEVIQVSPTEVLIREAQCIFDSNDHYYDSMPIDIVPCIEGRVRKLHWSNKRQAWQDTGPHNDMRDYPLIFHNSGEFEYYPYLD